MRKCAQPLWPSGGSAAQSAADAASVRLSLSAAAEVTGFGLHISLKQQRPDARCKRLLHHVFAPDPTRRAASNLLSCLCKQGLFTCARVPSYLYSARLAVPASWRSASGIPSQILASIGFSGMPARSPGLS